MSIVMHVFGTCVYIIKAILCHKKSNSLTFKIELHFLQAYNGQQIQGANLELGYQILFASSLTPPKIVSFTFNGFSICSNIIDVTTTTVVTTAMPAPATPTGGSLN